MYQKIILVLFILNGDLINADSVADSWILFANAVKDSWTHCPAINGVWGCLKQSSLEVFDKMTKVDEIPLLENVRFVRLEHLKKLSLESDIKMDKKSFGVSSLSLESWSKHILERFIDLFKTHTLSIGKSANEGRRRRQNEMVPMMVLGATALGVFTVPMGFQFLLIVCGKAILLAKMALLLSSINGSSRVKHSDPHYGLYQPYGHGYYNWNRDDLKQPTSKEI